ncbi:MAG: class I SAM-dependent methyltransferase [Ectothiorhodospiraceae bacterium]|nr:class I SAM-dependent methyltransferase [Ectothiorhodospiraceae bacterium]
MDTSARFWDRIADRYARRPVADEAAYRTKLAKTREYLRPDMEVLELGCGTGSTALEHAPHVAHIRAVDISSRMIAIARDKADAAGVTNVVFEVAGIDDLEVPDGSLDVVLALSLLHLVEDAGALLARIHRMLKPGGLLVTSTPCIGDSWATAAVVRVVRAVGGRLGLVPRVIEVFSLDALLATMRGAGFEIEHQWRPSPDKAAFVVARRPLHRGRTNSGY